MDKLEKKLKAKECYIQNSLEFQLSYFEDFFMGQHKDKFILDQKADISESAGLFYGIDSSKKLKSQRSSLSENLKIDMKYKEN
jgi:hypothetical protein